MQERYFRYYETRIKAGLIYFFAWLVIIVVCQLFFSTPQ